jgi:hypothetical protein
MIFVRFVLQGSIQQRDGEELLKALNRCGTLSCRILRKCTFSRDLRRLICSLYASGCKKKAILGPVNFYTQRFFGKFSLFFVVVQVKYFFATCHPSMNTSSLV